MLQYLTFSQNLSILSWYLTIMTFFLTILRKSPLLFHGKNKLPYNTRLIGIYIRAKNHQNVNIAALIVFLS